MLKSILTALPAAAIGVIALGFTAAPAHAVAVDVTYSLPSIQLLDPTGSTVTLNGSGSMTVRFWSATSGGHVSAGPLHVVSGTAAFTSSFQIDVLGNIHTFTGAQNQVFGGSGIGSVTAGGLFNLQTTGHVTSGFVHCAGVLCSASFVLGAPASVNVPLTSQTRPFNFGGLLVGFPSLTPHTFTATGTGGTQGGQPLPLLVTGQEVGRAVVPEPGTGLLVGLGLAGLGVSGGAFGARRRR